MKILFCLLMLAGCGAGACKQITLVQPEAPPQVIVHTVYLPQPTNHAALLKTYAATVPKQVALAKHASAPAIWALVGLSINARKALVPLQQPKHRATPAEVQHAIAAVGELKAYVDAPHLVVPPPAPIKLTVPK